MNKPSLRNVALKTIQNTRHAAEHAVEAYRASGHRLVGAVDRRLERSFYMPAERLAPRVNRGLQRMRGRIKHLTELGIDRVSAQTGRAIAFGTNAAVNQVTWAAERADRLDNATLARGLQAAAQASLTGARVALAISERLAGGAEKLSAAAAGRGAKTAVQRAGRRSVRARPDGAQALGRAQAAKKGRKTAKPQAATPAKPAARRRAKTRVAASA